MRDDKCENQISQNPCPLRYNREGYEDDANDGDVDVKVSGQTVTNAAEHGALADLIEALAGACPRAGPPVTRSVALGWPTSRAFGAFDRSHVSDDLLNFEGGDNCLVWAEKPIALVGNGLLEVGDDLLAIRVVFELDLSPIQVSTQQIVGRLVELIGMAVQIDRDHFLHGYRPSWPIVALIDFQ